MWYKNTKIVIPEFVKRPVCGVYEKDVEVARKIGARYRKWADVQQNWYANAGINRPFAKYILRDAKKCYSDIKTAYESKDHDAVLEYQNYWIANARERIKSIFDDPKCTMMFDSNGSCVISTIAKGLRGLDDKFQTLTFSDQGRLVYSALGFETDSISKFSMNFDQPLQLLDAPSPRIKIHTKPTPPKEVNVLDIFHPNNTYKSDALIIDEYRKLLTKNKDIRMVLLLHVSRTGRRMPVEDLIEITHRIRDDVSVFVDGCQAVGRISWREVKHVYSQADGYIFVGHKALGSMISGVAVLKEGMERKLEGIANNSLLYHFRLFQFETERMNELILHRCARTGKHYFFVSAPEAISLSEAVIDNSQNYWEYHKIIASRKEDLSQFLNEYDCIRMNLNNCPIVDDIIAFHTDPPLMAPYIKDYLQRSNEPITVAPLTDNLAVRIAIDPKNPNLPTAIPYLKKKLAEAIEQF